jgi:hypothetical protein
MATQPHTDPFPRPRPPSELTLEVQALLSRYPNLSEDELAALIRNFPHVPIRDVALMTADDRLSERFEAFQRDHGPELRPGVASLVIFLSYPAILVVGVLWWFLS